MSEDSVTDHAQQEANGGRESGFFTPAVCAVAAFTLAIAALLGDSPLTVGLTALLGSALGSSWTTLNGGWGAATALEALLALLLAWRGLAGSGGWESVLARAAILICVVALVGALLTVVAAQVDQPGNGF